MLFQGGALRIVYFDVKSIWDQCLETVFIFTFVCCCYDCDVVQCFFLLIILPMIVKFASLLK